MSTVTTLTKPLIPGIPAIVPEPNQLSEQGLTAVKSELDNKASQSDTPPTIYSLYYIPRYDNKTKEKRFKLVGNMGDAIVRGKKHCLLMNVKFVRIEPFLADLDLDEKNKVNF